MGLPVFREPAIDEPTTKTDPTAQSRSTIRRHIRRAVAPSLQRSSTSRLRHAENTSSVTSSVRPRQRHPEEILDLNTSNVQPTASARPRSRRGPSRDFDNMPPLRRMGNRQIANEMDRPESNDRPAATVTIVNGLGDRERSWSPDGETDTWAVMGSTIEPDAHLPSASTSFASGAERSFETRMEELSEHFPQNRLITSFFAPDNDAQDDNEETLRVLGELDRQARMSRMETESTREENFEPTQYNSNSSDLTESASRQQQISPPMRLTTPPYLRDLVESVSRRQQTNPPMRAPTPPAGSNPDQECPVVDRTSNSEELAAEERTFQQLSDQFLEEVNDLLHRRTHRGSGVTSTVIRRMLNILNDDREREEARSRRRIASHV